MIVTLIINVVLAISGAWLTYHLNKNLKLGPVRASGLIAILVGGFYQFNTWFWHFDLPKDIPFIVIGSTFIGMISSRKHFKNFNLFIAPIIFTLIYHNISKEFKGFGGALGTAACISLVVTIYLRSLRPIKKMIRPFRKVKVNTMKKRSQASKNI
ncbi:hypothetical protein ACK1KB_05285 [Chryseobacterium sp. TY3]